MQDFARRLLDMSEDALKIPFQIESGESNFEICKGNWKVFSGATLKFECSGQLFCELNKSNKVLLKIPNNQMTWPAGSSGEIGSNEELQFRCMEYECTTFLNNIPLQGFYEFAVFDFKRADDFFPPAIYFLIPNSRLTGKTYVKNSKAAWCGRIKDTFKDFEICIDQINLPAQIKKNNHISHILEFKATKGHFTVKDFDKYADYLQKIFSFLNGHWVAPVLGFAYRDNVPELMWASSKLVSTKPKYVVNWYIDSQVTFDDHYFQKAFQFISNEFNESLFQHCLSWYFDSMGPDYQKSILANHIALEMLSWGVVFEDKEVVSEDGFNSLIASDKICLLLNEVGISKTIPGELSHLQTYSVAKNQKSGPSTLSKIRNSIVHPKKEHRDSLDKIGFDVYEEAHALGLWYLESSLLSLLKYHGRVYKPYGANTIHDPFNCLDVNFEN